MQRYKLLSIWILMVFCLNLSCWKKQTHEITAPKIPKYPFSGMVTDIGSSELLSDVVVRVIAVELTYEDDFTQADDTTDAQGRYFFEAVSPGQYLVQCIRNGYPVIEENMVMEHQEKIFDFSTPMPLVARQNYGPPEHPSFRGLCTKEAGVLAGGWKYDMVWIGNFAEGFELYGRDVHAYQNPQVGSIVYLGGFWYNGAGTDSNIIFSLDAGRGNVAGQTVTDFVIRDMTADKTYLWATTELGKLVQFDGHPASVKKVHDLNISQPYAIATDSKYFWATSFTTHFIYKLDMDLNIIAAYRPFAYWQGRGIEPLKNLFYLTFEPSGYLYANDKSYVYSFKL
ncbi:carboxypeptidase regulatory-like domain-containing protein [candidate division KSB1 bacterium]|nr:carboxypeptidase regulatory-like domain-containing protein [candidate division KSB1 bacterium]